MSDAGWDNWAGHLEATMGRTREPEPDAYRLSDRGREFDDETGPYGYCEDYPCCGHTDKDPCPGRGSPVAEPWYCDICGIEHYYECPEEW